MTGKIISESSATRRAMLEDASTRPGAGPRRLPAIDAAKGVSILLVVALHIGTYWHLNEFFKLLRMPLFFFAAGLFAFRSMELPWKIFLRSKAGNTFYIFLVWVVFGWIARHLPYNLNGAGIFFRFPALQDFVSPVGVLWFMFALGLLYISARVLRRFLSFGLLIAALAIAIGASFAFEPASDNVYVKAVMALPFFLFAIFYHSEVKAFIVRYSGFWPAAALWYFLGCLLALKLPTVGYILLAPWVSAGGILAVFLFFSNFPNSALTRICGYAGTALLMIYLLHGVVIYHLRKLLESMGVERTNLVGLLLVPLIAVTCVLFGRYVLKPITPWLFEAPWLSRLRPAPGIASPAAKAV